MHTKLNHGLSWVWQGIKLLWRFLVCLKNDFMQHQCFMTAAALTYMTLFALVPLMTVIYAVFSVIPAFDGVALKLQQWLFAHLVPETGQEIQSYFTEFSLQAYSLTGIGVGFLFLTAYLMLSNIEKTFNRIWGVVKARRGLSSVLLYWAILSIGPLLLGAGLAMSTYVMSMQFFNQSAISPWIPVWTDGITFVLKTLVFTLLFAAVPNCKVPIRFALMGGFFAALMFHFLKEIFAVVVANSNYSDVYGAFAAVPLFLVWINLVWIVVLMGAILVRNLAERNYLNHESKLPDLLAAFRCLALLVERHQEGEGISEQDCVSLGLGLVQWHRIQQRLEAASVVATRVQGDCILSRDLHQITLGNVIEIIADRSPPYKTLLKFQSDDVWWPNLNSRLDLYWQASQSHLDISLAELFTPSRSFSNG